MMSEFTLVEAASGGRPKVVGTAYGGGKMKLPGWKYPVVVDLAGMEIPDSVPLLANHDNRTSARVGMVTATVADGALGITGEIVQPVQQRLEIKSSAADQNRRPAST